MFKLIPPSKHESFRGEIDSYLKDLKNYNPDLYKTIQQKKNRSTFILFQDHPHQIQGGAMLFEQRPSSLHPELRAQFKDSLYFDQPIWGGTLCLHFKEETQGQTFESICKVFYRGLYESLIAFGVMEQTRSLCLTLDPCEHLSTEFIGLWPYKVQVRRKDSKDGLFHGVLSLTGNQNKLRDAA